MHSVSGIYDGEKIQLLEQPPVKTPCKVIITFVEEETESFRNYTADEDAFDFWEAEEEDLYQDYLKKNKCKPVLLF